MFAIRVGFEPTHLSVSASKADVDAISPPDNKKTLSIKIDRVQYF